MAFNRASRHSIMGASPDDAGRAHRRSSVAAFPAEFSKGPRSSASARSKSQPGSTGTALMQVGGPSPAVTGPSPGVTGPSPYSWGASPVWNSSPNAGYPSSMPAEVDTGLSRAHAGEQWWLLEARKIRGETRRLNGEYARLRSLAADKEEKVKDLKSMVKNKTEHVDRLSAELRVAADNCNTWRTELKQSQDVREQQEANIMLFTEEFEKLMDARHQFQDTEVGRCAEDLKDSRAEGRELGRQLRRVETSLDNAQRVARAEEAAAMEGRECQAAVTNFRSELESGQRHRQEVEECLRQTLEQVQTAKVDPAELKRSSVEMRQTAPKEGDAEYATLVCERNVLQEELTQLREHLKNIQEMTRVDPQSPSNASQARLTSDFESSGCDDNTIYAWTPRSQMTAASREPSEAHFRLDRDIMSDMELH